MFWQLPASVPADNAFVPKGAGARRRLSACVLVCMRGNHDGTVRPLDEGAFGLAHELDAGAERLAVLMFRPSLLATGSVNFYWTIAQ